MTKIAPLQLAKAMYELYEDAKNERERKSVTAAFVRYMHKKNLLVALPKVFRELKILEKKEKGILPVEIVSFRDLTKQECGDVATAAARYFQKDKSKLELHFQKDQSLLGGLLMKTGEVLIDNTVRNQLQQLSKKLVR